MPGTLPVLRRRRLAPVPCNVRSKATNFMVTLQCVERPRPGAPVEASGPQAHHLSGRPWAPASSSEIIVLLREQRRHRLAVADATDRLGEQERHRQLADLLARLRFLAQRDRVGDRPPRRAATVRCARSPGPRTPGACSRHRRASRHAPSARSAAFTSVPAVSIMSSMIDAVAAFDLADHMHHLGRRRPSAGACR